MKSTGGRTVLWCYAPGVTDGKTLDAVRVETWAGVEFKTPGISVTPMSGWTSVYSYDYKLYNPWELTRIASRRRSPRLTRASSACRHRNCGNLQSPTPLVHVEVVPPTCRGVVV